jgi:hypothetical protein
MMAGSSLYALNDGAEVYCMSLMMPQNFTLHGMNDGAEVHTVCNA